MRSILLYYLVLVATLALLITVVAADWNLFKYFGGAGSAILYVGIPFIALQTVKTFHMNTLL